MCLCTSVCMFPAVVWSLWTGGGLIDLIKMKAIDSVMNLQHLIYIIQKAELHLSTDINGNSSPPNTHTQKLTSTKLSKWTPWNKCLLSSQMVTYTNYIWHACLKLSTCMYTHTKIIWSLATLKLTMVNYQLYLMNHSYNDGCVNKKKLIMDHRFIQLILLNDQWCLSLSGSRFSTTCLSLNMTEFQVPTLP